MTKSTIAIKNATVKMTIATASYLGLAMINFSFHGMKAFDRNPLSGGAFVPLVSQTHVTRENWISARYHQLLQFMALCAHQENLTRSVLQNAKQISSNYSLLLTNSCCFSHPLQQQVLGDNVKPQEKDDKNKNVISFFLRFGVNDY